MVHPKRAQRAPPPLCLLLLRLLPWLGGRKIEQQLQGCIIYCWQGVYAISAALLSTGAGEGEEVQEREGAGGRQQAGLRRRDMGQWCMRCQHVRMWFVPEVGSPFKGCKTDVY